MTHKTATKKQQQPSLMLKRQTATKKRPASTRSPPNDAMSPEDPAHQHQIIRKKLFFADPTPNSHMPTPNVSQPESVQTKTITPNNSVKSPTQAPTTEKGPSAQLRTQQTSRVTQPDARSATSKTLCQGSAAATSPNGTTSSPLDRNTTRTTKTQTDTSVSPAPNTQHSQVQATFENNLAVDSGAGVRASTTVTSIEATSDKTQISQHMDEQLTSSAQSDTHQHSPCKQLTQATPFLLPSANQRVTPQF
jgi:hypothetical protein